MFAEKYQKQALINNRNFMKIFVIIVTYNGMRCIKKCLESIDKSKLSLLPVVIDNNSNDNTVAFIKRNYPQFKIIENSINYGFGRANNIGLKYAIKQDADFVFLLNQDAWIAPDTIEKLIILQRANPQFGIISPVHLTGKGDELARNFVNYTPYKTIAEVRNAYRQGVSFIETKFVSATCWLLSKDCIFKIGGFDPLFMHYGEDRDYCNRVMYYGYKIGVVLNTAVCHDRKYGNDNQYRKPQNFLFTAGLAHIKNINKNIWLNYLSWVIKRSRKIIKSLLYCDFIYFYAELIVLGKLLMSTKKISNSRTISRNASIPYLKEDGSEI